MAYKLRSLSFLPQGPRCNHRYRYNLRFSRRDRWRLPRDDRLGEMLQIPQSLHKPVLPQTWYTCRQDGASTSTRGECGLFHYQSSDIQCLLTVCRTVSAHTNLHVCVCWKYAGQPPVIWKWKGLFQFCHNFLMNMNFDITNPESHLKCVCVCV